MLFISSHVTRFLSHYLADNLIDIGNEEVRLECRGKDIGSRRCGGKKP